MSELPKRYSVFDYIVGYTFALAATGAGVVTAYKAIEHLADYALTRSWIEVPAVIETSRLEVSEHGGRRHVSYRAEALYHYSYNGRRHSGTRTSLSEMFDNVGSFQKEMAARLKRCEQLSSCTAWINPNNPVQSMLDRSLRPGIVLVFGSISAALLAFGIFCFKFIWRARNSSA